jgi:hypothetical protein
MVGTLRLFLSHFADPGKIRSWFEEACQGDMVFLECRRRGLWRRYVLTFTTKHDCLTEAESRWLLLHMDHSVTRAIFETDAVGLTGHVDGSPFRMTMNR